MKTNGNKNKVCFAALEPYLQTNIPEPVQRESGSYVKYGADNLYPQYLLGLYEGCSTLKAIIDGNVDYVLGDDFTLNANLDKYKASDVMREAIRDWYIFGYAFLQIIRNPLGEVVDIVHLPSEWVRTDKDRQAFWYCEKWKGWGNAKAVVYPAFMNDPRQATGVLMLGSGRGTYPAPLWSAAVTDAEIERKVDTYHLSEISQNFLSSLLVNFNNGTPDDKIKKEIEDAMTEKFSGAENAGRMMLSFNENVTNRTTVERLGTDDFDKRYEALAKRTREQMFSDLFRLYNKTMISPRQDMLRRAFAKIYGSDVLTITPFAI